MSNDVEIEELERLLKKMQPCELSETFFRNVAAELAPDDEVGADIEAKLGRLVPVAPSERFLEKVSEELSGGVASSKRGVTIPFPRWMSAAAAVTLAATGILVWNVPFENPHKKVADAVPSYKLVSTESSLSDIQGLPIETREDGTLVRPVRYIYTSTNRWEDPATKKTYIEHRPYEKVVPTLVAVY